MSQLPPLAALRCFEAVARLGSVTQAARELHVTHSAVSQQIRILETAIGVALFVREARGLRPTEQGRLYALDIRAVLRSLTQATQLAQARPQESDLVIAALPSFALHWLVPRLARFRALHPYYRVRLQTSLDIQDLRHGDVDIGIRMGHGAWPGLAVKALFEDELIVVCAPHFRGGQLPASATEIVACPLIRSTDVSWADWCGAAGVPEPSSGAGMSANDSNIVLACVVLGEGLALERRSLVAGALGRGELVQVSEVSVAYPYRYWLAWRQQDAPSARQMHFIEWMDGEVQRYVNGGATQNA
jgi:LysR family glycine cleavage system transcriptional activator